jgi:hypothetical protein
MPTQYGYIYMQIKFNAKSRGKFKNNMNSLDRSEHEKLNNNLTSHGKEKSKHYLCVAIKID